MSALASVESELSDRDVTRLRMQMLKAPNGNRRRRLLKMIRLPRQAYHDGSLQPDSEDF